MVCHPAGERSNGHEPGHAVASGSGSGLLGMYRLWHRRYSHCRTKHVGYPTIRPDHNKPVSQPIAAAHG
jgi:hypothetical protein